MSDEHPLVIRFGAFGDMVMLTPMLQRLYRRCGRPADLLAAGSWNHLLFMHSPFVRNIHIINSRRAPYWLSPEKWRVAAKLREHDYYGAWICESRPEPYRLAARGGIDPSQSVRAIDHPQHEDELFSSYLNRLGDLGPPGLDCPADDDVTLDSSLTVAAEEVTACRNWLQTLGIDDTRPLVCIQPGNRKTTRKGRIDRDSNTKYWHEKHWAGVINIIHADLPDAEIMLCGVPAEYSMTRDIQELCLHRKRTHAVANDLPMRRLLALLSISHSCISVDTGPAHAAAALNCPVTVLFGKADARNCSPVSAGSRVSRVFGRIPGSELGPGWQSWAECHDISLITVEDVIHAWEQSLE